MPTPYSADDLRALFEPKVLTRGRTLVLFGAVEVALDGDSITAAVADGGTRRTAMLTPAPRGNRVGFGTRCSCRQPACAHLAAAGLAALDRFPALRRAANAPLDVPAAQTAVRRLVFDLAAASPPHACTVAAITINEGNGRTEGITPEAIIADPMSSEDARVVAGLMTGMRCTIAPEQLSELIEALLESGQGRWSSNGRRLVPGPPRSFEAGVPPPLPAHSAVLMGDDGNWYIDASTGATGQARFRAAEVKPAKPVRGRKREAIPLPALESDRVIVERTATPILRLRKRHGPDELGRPALLDALTLDFDYAGENGGHGIAEADDERQFVRISGPRGPEFVRRDPAAEAVSAAVLADIGFVQLRVADGSTGKGRRVYVLRGPDSAEQWHRFMTERIPALQEDGWECVIEAGFGPRVAKIVGGLDARVSDAERGSFSLDLGIEVDGVRVPLLPILVRLMERGPDALKTAGEELVTSLEDGRVVRLPAERVRRLMAVMGDLIEAAANRTDSALVLPQGEAAAVLDLEELLTTRWQDAAEVAATVERFRELPPMEHVPVPASFTASLRPYQQHGLDWLQHLRSHNLGGFLADEMGLGKTAQTIAHITTEHAAGRLDRPVLVVMPTSLVANWQAELGRFAPHLGVAVLHGQGREAIRARLKGVAVVLTTYAVLARDAEPMKEIAWHMIVLDEAQAIKSPEAKATRAVCQLDARHRVCLSGTPIENNLDELWSQFAFLQPGLLGDRKSFGKRFRSPIEKEGDPVRRGQLARRIKPFILRRTKVEVATELPPKETILRHITFGAEQRELYDTIRATLHDTVRDQLAELGPGQGRFVVLNALLKLRQACCDPRLVKLSSGQSEAPSAKLDTLMEMIGGMLPEGRRILVFSQFTSMLDLIKDRLNKEGHRFVELRGDTRDRAEPVRAFQAQEVPLFLISLKAGGRGLNLTAADTVIHYDPWWNPAVEDQASDRAHRIGQTKSVFVYKLIAADTVEERIIQLQERKAELANIALDSEVDAAGLDADDLEFLLNSETQKRAA
jgi:superfamily II DNA or RNA helicase